MRYYNLLTSENIYDYLANVERRAENLFEQTVKLPAEQEQINAEVIFNWEKTQPTEMKNPSAVPDFFAY